MKNVSNAFWAEMELRRDFYCTAEITFEDGRVKGLEKDDFALSGNSVTESPGGSSLPLGTVIPKQITLSLNNYDDRWSDFDFQWAKIFLRTKYDLNDGRTEIINIGNFTVITPESYGTIVEIVAMDDCYKLDKEYATSLSYPVSLGMAVRDSCSSCGVSLLTTAFENDDFVIQEKPENLTHRKFIGLCAMIAGGNARFDGNNRLAFITYDFTRLQKSHMDGGIFDTGNPNRYETGERLDGGSFYPWNVSGVYDGGQFGDRNDIHVLFAFNSGFKIETDDVIITGVKLKSKGEEEVLFGEEGYVLSVENQLSTGKEMEAAQLIGEKMVGLRFRPFSGDHVSYPLAEFGDLALLVDRKQNVYQTVITDVNFSYCGFTTLKCTAESPIRNSSKYYGSETKAVVLAKKETEKQITDYDRAMKELSSILANSLGIYETYETLEDGSTVKYQHNKPTLAESMTIWKKTGDAFAVSTDGGKTWNAGMDSSGRAVVNVLSAVGLSASWLETGSLVVKKGNKTVFLVDVDTGRVEIVADVFSLSSGKTIEGLAQEAVDSQTQEDIFNKLFKPDGVKVDGVELRDGKIYISATYIDTGELSADRIKGGELAIGGTENGITMDGKILSFLKDGEEYGYIESYYGRDMDTPGINISSDYGSVMFRVNSSPRGQPKLTYPVMEVLSYQSHMERYGGDYYPVRFGINAPAFIGRVSIGDATFNNSIRYNPISVSSSEAAVFFNGVLLKSSASSKRYKEIGRDMSYKDIEGLYNITPVWAKFKEGYLDKGDERCGVEHPMFIAEDVDRYAPLAVDHDKNGKAENWNYRVMIPYMFQMLKSQNEKIAAMEEGLADIRRLIRERGVGYGNPKP